MPSEKYVFTTRVDPISPPKRPPYRWLILVEAPGTAPGSTTSIPRIVYRHSRKTDAIIISIPA